MDKMCPLKNNAKCETNCAWYIDELPSYDMGSKKIYGCSFSLINYQIYELNSGLEKIEDMIRDELIFSLDNVSKKLDEMRSK